MGVGLAWYWTLALRPVQLASAAVALFSPKVSGSVWPEGLEEVPPSERSIRLCAWGLLSLLGWNLRSAPRELCMASAMRACLLTADSPQWLGRWSDINWSAALLWAASITPAFGWVATGLALLGGLLPRAWGPHYTLVPCITLMHDLWAAFRWPLRLSFADAWRTVAAAWRCVAGAAASGLPLLQALEAVRVPLSRACSAFVEWCK